MIKMIKLPQQIDLNQPIQIIISVLQKPGQRCMNMQLKVPKIHKKLLDKSPKYKIISLNAKPCLYVSSCPVYTMRCSKPVTSPFILFCFLKKRKKGSWKITGCLVPCLKAGAMDLVGSVTINLNASASIKFLKTLLILVWINSKFCWNVVSASWIKPLYFLRTSSISLTHSDLSWTFYSLSRKKRNKTLNWVKLNNDEDLQKHCKRMHIKPYLHASWWFSLLLCVFCLVRFEEDLCKVIETAAQSGSV